MGASFQQEIGRLFDWRTGEYTGPPTPLLKLREANGFSSVSYPRCQGVSIQNRNLGEIIPLSLCLRDTTAANQASWWLSFSSAKKGSLYIGPKTNIPTLACLLKGVCNHPPSVWWIRNEGRKLLEFTTQSDSGKLPGAAPTLRVGAVAQGGVTQGWRLPMRQFQAPRLITRKLPGWGGERRSSGALLV